MTRLRILNDLAFQKALGEKGDEPQLLAFLNAVLERTGKNNLQSVEILEGKDIAAETVGGKSGRLDVLAKLASGAKVNIEVQNRNDYNIEKRSLYYWSRKYAETLEAGDDYAELVPVIGINIIDFGYGPLPDFHTSYHLWEDRHKDTLLTDVCEIHFLDMVKFRRAGKRDLENPLDRWLVYFDERSPENLVEEVINMDSAIRLVQEKLNQIGLDPGLRRTYEGIEKAERDRISSLNAVKREADRRVSEADRRISEADRRVSEADRRATEADRRAAEAARKRDWEIARNLKANGFPAEQIAELTGLSEAQIREL
jgi:predicted transposase/invertase (TIGR01784 family)